MLHASTTDHLKLVQVWGDKWGVSTDTRENNIWCKFPELCVTTTSKMLWCGTKNTALPLCSTEQPEQTLGGSMCMPVVPRHLIRAGKVAEGAVHRRFRAGSRPNWRVFGCKRGRVAGVCANIPLPVMVPPLAASSDLCQQKSSLSCPSPSPSFSQSMLGPLFLPLLPRLTAWLLSLWVLLFHLLLLRVCFSIPPHLSWAFSHFLLPSAPGSLWTIFMGRYQLPSTSLARKLAADASSTPLTLPLSMADWCSDIISGLYATAIVFGPGWATPSGTAVAGTASLSELCQWCRQVTSFFHTTFKVILKWKWCTACCLGDLDSNPGPARSSPDGLRQIHTHHPKGLGIASCMQPWGQRRKDHAFPPPQFLTKRLASLS